MERKYREYLTIVEYPNGDSDSVDYMDEREIDTTNYREMLEVYRTTKDQYEGVNCTIRFMGRSSEGEFVEMFSKTFNNLTEEAVENTNLEQFMSYNDDEEDIKNTEEETENLETQETEEDADEIVRDYEKSVIEKLNIIKEACEWLDSEYNKSRDKQGYFDKKISEIMHIDIENMMEATDSHKIEVFDKLKTIRKERRDQKRAYAILDVNRNKINTIKNTITNCLDKTDRYIKKCDDKVKEIENKSGKAYDMNRTKEYPYSNFKERMRLMKELTQKYDKVVHDSDRRVICVYNKIYK